MRQQDHSFRTVSASVVDGLLHIFFFDAERPVFNQVAWVGDRRVGKRLTNDCNVDAVHFTHRIGVKHGVFKIGRFDVLSDKIYFAIKIFFYNFFDAFFA